MPDARFFAETPQSVGIDPLKLDRLFQRAEKEVRAGLLPSVQIAVARGGKIAAMRTFGTVTHAGRSAAATDDTLYVVFSATKAITSAAAWLLIEAGALRLDERVSYIIPEFATNGKDVVTVEQLFTHTCGFPYAPFDPLQWDDREARLERFRRWRLDWAPGTRIATPLGLPDLHVGLPRAQHHRLADIVHSGAEPSPDELRALGFPVIPAN